MIGKISVNFGVETRFHESSLQSNMDFKSCWMRDHTQAAGAATNTCYHIKIKALSKLKVRSSKNHRMQHTLRSLHKSISTLHPRHRFGSIRLTTAARRRCCIHTSSSQQPNKRHQATTITMCHKPFKPSSAE